MAPDLGGLELDLAETSGLTVGDEPMALIFLTEGHALFSCEGEREAIRAQLRALGAFVLAVSPEGLWCFRPDDETQVMKRAAELPENALAEAARRYRIPFDAADGPGLRALFVLDEKRTLRFAHLTRVDEAMTLSDAMTCATRAMMFPPTPVPDRTGTSRREFLVLTLVAGFATAVSESCARPRTAASVLHEELDVALNVNGQVHHLRIEPRVSLLDALREELRLTGTKKGCDHGQCGACTVLVDGRRINSCLTLAVMAEGAAITTIEGLGDGETLHPVQAAFVAEDALQCGYCTPGQIMSAVGLMSEGHAHGDDEIRESMSGNLCRCGAYPNIVAAIRRARGGAKAGTQEGPQAGTQEGPQG